MCWPHDYQQVFFPGEPSSVQCEVMYMYLCYVVYVLLVAGDNFLVYSVLILLEYGVDVWSLFQLFLEK